MTKIPPVKVIGFLELDSTAVIDGIKNQAELLSKAYSDTLHTILSRECTQLFSLMKERR